ncbi:hypothetical protein [Microvirga yunnanensis]|uniref:hypothetical protein n=1 Tax=Microvirga yunnanensis TaxID=2953740 RepID=UPI0021C91534|nr:hypothetical protein [Microvirga sp. HBU65207]
MPGAPMIRVCRQSEFLAHAESLDHWVMARERAIATLERKAAWLAEQGAAEQAARLRAAARHLRHAAFEERLRASRLRQAAATG